MAEVALEAILVARLSAEGTVAAALQSDRKAALNSSMQVATLGSGEAPPILITVGNLATRFSSSLDRLPPLAKKTVIKPTAIFAPKFQLYDNEGKYDEAGRR